MQRKIKLKEVANVITGYTFRGAIIPDLEGSLFVLQAKNIKGDLVITDDVLIKTSVETSHTNAFVKDGDVVVGSRGIFRSAVVKSKEKIIASSSIYIIRPVSDDILPEYIALYLNSNIGKNKISKVVTGAYIKNLLRRNLENFEIPVLSIEKQKNLIALYKNIKKQRELTDRKNQLKQNIINATIYNLNKK